MNRWLYFDGIKEHRGSYFVEYRPPVADNQFATLNVILLHQVPWERVTELLDTEIRFWMERYPVPLMVWASNDKEEILRPPDDEGDCLVAWIAPVSGEIVQSWDINDLSDIPASAPPHQDWRTVYADVPVRTDAEVKAEAYEKSLERSRQVWLLKIALMLWLAVIPVGYAIFEFLGPEWLGLIGLIFVIWQALKVALRIWGYTESSAREVVQAEKKRKMEHYFYHCERNPEGFLRLKSENFESDARERVWKEADQLATKTDRQCGTPDGW